MGLTGGGRLLPPVLSQPCTFEGENRNLKGRRNEMPRVWVLSVVGTQGASSVAASAVYSQEAGILPLWLGNTRP